MTKQKHNANRPASILKVTPGTGLPTLRSAHLPTPETPAEAEKEAYETSLAECEDNLATLRATDKLGEFMDQAPWVGGQTTTQVWGIKAAPEKVYTFTRWYFMTKDNAIIDLFPKQELYDAADVEGRRAMAHKYGTRYAALGPKHSRAPYQDKALRKQYPSLVEQLSEKF
jgi:hypothetical protein